MTRYDKPVFGAIWVAIWWPFECSFEDIITLFLASVRVVTKVFWAVRINVFCVCSKPFHLITGFSWSTPEDSHAVSAGRGSHRANTTTEFTIYNQGGQAMVRIFEQPTTGKKCVEIIDIERRFQTKWSYSNCGMDCKYRRFVFPTWGQIWG